MRSIGFFFGGVSPEHEVSVLSTLQAMHALDRSRFSPIPVYVAKDGRWFTGEPLLDTSSFSDLDALLPRLMQVQIDPAVRGKMGLRVIPRTRWVVRPFLVELDVVFLGFHGGSGENGAMQGVCEMLDAPYTGSGILGSAVGMDKAVAKALCRAEGFPVVEAVSLREKDWAGCEEQALDRCEAALPYPMIVKPARLGSSIGISKAKDRRALDAAIEEAFRYDDKVLVERAITDLREVNCAVLGLPGDAVASVLEEPVRSAGQELLTFEEKYLRGGGASGAKGSKAGPPGATRGAKHKARAAGMASLDRIIPAPLDPALTDTLRKLAVDIFSTFECAGVARLDFLLDAQSGAYYFNEINTIPGSFSFYLWEPTGVPFTSLVSRLIDTALERHRSSHERVRSFSVNLLSSKSLGGLKGTKTRS